MFIFIFTHYMMQSIFSWHGTKGHINYYYQFPYVDVIVINSFSLKLLENMVKNYMLSEIFVKVFRSGFRKSIQILMFPSPLLHVPLPFTKMNVLHYDLKKDAINEFGIKYWTSNPIWVTFQHGSSFYVNIEEKVWLLVNKIRTWKDWQGD
jgi:hypothetical protein